MAVVISADSLRSLGSDTSYERGLQYASEGHVGTVSQHGQTVRATVNGREPYGVRLVLDDGGLTGHCTCPMGAEGDFCKHCIALAIVWSEQGPEHRIEPAGDVEVDGAELAEEAVLRLSRDDLVDILVGQAGRDPAVAAELSARAGTMPEPDDSTLRSMYARLTSVLSTDTIQDADIYYEVEALVEELAYLVRTACSHSTVGLVEDAMRRWGTIRHLDHDIPELRALERRLDEILQEARHLVTVRKPLDAD